MLAHGGGQVQIEQTMAALMKVGVEVEPLRWWDDKQTGDIIQQFGRISPGSVNLAHEKGIKLIISELLTQQGSRSRLHHFFHRSMVRVLPRVLPRNFIMAFGWE